MKFHCPISGEIWEIPGPRTISPLEHPIFSLPWNDLLRLEKQWRHRKLSQTDIRLYCLALFNCTSLVQWQEPAKESISLEAYIPPLLEFNSFFWDNARIVSNRYDLFPRIVIDTNTCNLRNFRSWLACWKSGIADYYGERWESRQVAKEREWLDTFDRLIKRNSANPSLFIKHLARWAAKAANFPNSYIIRNDKRIKRADYWIYCLECCASKDKDFRIYTITQDDLVKLQDHLIEHLSLDNLYAFTLLDLIKNTLQDINFFSHSSYEIIEAEKEQDQAILALPRIEIKPEKCRFASNLEYLKVLNTWNQQQAALRKLTEENQKNESD